MVEIAPVEVETKLKELNAFRPGQPDHFCQQFLKELAHYAANPGARIFNRLAKSCLVLYDEKTNAMSSSPP